MERWTADLKYDSQSTHKEKKGKEETNKRILLTNHEISKLLPPLNPLALLHGHLDAPDHHCANEYRKHAPELRAVYGQNLKRIFTVDVEGGADRLGL